MNAPAHHLDPATLLAYAAGALPVAFAVVAASHLQLCVPCRAALRAAEGVGAHLLEQLRGAPLSSSARATLRGRLDADPAPPAPCRATPRPPAPDALPGPLRPFFGDRYSRLRWTCLSPGVHYLDVRPDAQARLVLLRLEIGCAGPVHRHRGHALTMVLRGACQDGPGRFGPGDVADLDDGRSHRPLAVSRRRCIWACALAAGPPWRLSGGGAAMRRHPR